MSNKKKLGQFFTPPDIARFMTSWAITGSTRTFLDPAVGPGVFLDCADHVNSRLAKKAYDVDPLMLDKLEKSGQSKTTEILLKDYLLDDLGKKYDAIVCNPPYNKFQQIDNRYELIDTFRNKYNIKMSGYSNYCVYFLIKSRNELSENGRCCYIIPYEFLNAGYGETIKDYLINSRRVQAIIKIDNTLKVFSDAITTSCIILIDGKKHESIDFISVSDINKLSNERLYENEVVERKYSDLNSSEKWINYFNSNKRIRKYSNLIPFSDVAKVKRGIATGNNSFFTISKSQKRKLNLSDNVCVPCITKSPDVKNIIFDDSAYEKLLESDKKVYIFDGERACTDADYRYIKYGEENNYDKSYLTSHRTPWYSVEKKDVAPILISVFSRGSLKVVRNQKMIKNLTTFHGVFCIDKYADYVDILFCYLLTPLAQDIIKDNKREYGEGLDKFEPNDINHASILDFKVLSDNDLIKIKDIYANIRTIPNYTEQLNNIFSRYVLT